MWIMLEITERKEKKNGLLLLIGLLSENIKKIFPG